MAWLFEEIHEQKIHETALESHINKDSDKSWICEDCAEKPTFYTQSNFNQRRRDSHGTGFKSRCGKVDKWPELRKRHQEECEECKNILLAKQTKPENPVPKKLRIKAYSSKPKAKKEENNSDIEKQEKEDETKSDNGNKMKAEDKSVESEKDENEQ